MEFKLDVGKTNGRLVGKTNGRLWSNPKFYPGAVWLIKHKPKQTSPGKMEGNLINIGTNI